MSREIYKSVDGEIQIKKGFTKDQVLQELNRFIEECYQDHPVFQKITDALSYLLDVNATAETETVSDSVTQKLRHIDTGKFLISSDDSYYDKEKYDHIAELFDGKLDFMDIDTLNKFTLYLKDGKAIEAIPFELEVRPGETMCDTLARFISENKDKIDIRKVLDAMPDFVGGKVVMKDDVRDIMAGMDIEPEVQEEILDEAVSLIDKHYLNDFDDIDRKTIEYGIKDALEEYEKIQEDERE